MTEKGLAKLGRVGALVPWSSEGEEPEHYSSIQLRSKKKRSAPFHSAALIAFSMLKAISAVEWGWLTRLDMEIYKQIGLTQLYGTCLQRTTNIG